MSVNPEKQRKVVVVHGVQLGDDGDQNQHKAIQTLIDSRLGGVPLDFATEMFVYENINDEAQGLFSRITSAIANTPLEGVVTKAVIDLLGDVVISLRDKSTAQKIRAALKAQILAHYENGHPCYLVAHSLGSIYAFDVINELFKDEAYFERNARETWPVQGIMTLGSPIGLGLFNKNRKQVEKLGVGEEWFRWLNVWDRSDPVVSGKLFGTPKRGYDIAELYETSDEQQGWIIRDVIVDTQQAWILAHLGYWNNATVGDSLLNMIRN